jgi:hypothetical protein
MARTGPARPNSSRNDESIGIQPFHQRPRDAAQATCTADEAAIWLNSSRSLNGQSHELVANQAKAPVILVSRPDAGVHSIKRQSIGG